MKTRSIRNLIEPLVYIVLVAAFGFITTVVNHTRSYTPVTDSELVHQTMESQLNAMLTNDRQGNSKIRL